MAEDKISIEEASDEQGAEKYALEYGVDDVPPWHVTLVYAIQQILANIGSTIVTVYIIHGLLCTEGQEGADLLFAELLCASVFMMGVASLLQTALGVRLPIVQGSSGVFISPIIAMMNTEEWRCPEYVEGGGNITTDLPEESEKPWEPRLRVIAGSLMAASSIQIILGCTGVMGFLMTYIGPLTVIPTVGLVGFTLFETATAGAEHQWGIAILTVALIVIFSICMDNIGVPLPCWSRNEGCSYEKFRIFKLYPHVFAITIAWLLSYIFTVTDVFPPSTTDEPNYARTDAKIDVLKEASWFIVPYPGKMGGIEFSFGVFTGMSAAVIASIIESVGDYYATADMCQLPPPPKHAVNRGIAMEGIASFLSGALGVAHATTSYSGTIGFISLTGVASRWVWEIMSIILIVLGLFGKFGAALAIIPDPILGGLSVVGLGMVISVALSNVHHVDMQSTRNQMILAIAFMFGMMLPFWLNDNPGAIQTGNADLDNVLTILLSTGMLVGGAIGFTLDNLLPGTKEERGLISFNSPRTAETVLTSDDESATHLMSTYDLSFMTACEERSPCCSYLPFMPSYSEENYNCCKCCSLNETSASVEPMDDGKLGDATETVLSGDNNSAVVKKRINTEDDTINETSQL